MVPNRQCQKKINLNTFYFLGIGWRKSIFQNLRPTHLKCLKLSLFVAIRQLLGCRQIWGRLWQYIICFFWKSMLPILVGVFLVYGHAGHYNHSLIKQTLFCKGESFYGKVGWGRHTIPSRLDISRYILLYIYIYLHIYTHTHIYIYT